MSGNERAKRTGKLYYNNTYIPFLPEWIQSPFKLISELSWSPSGWWMTSRAKLPSSTSCTLICWRNNKMLVSWGPLTGTLCWYDLHTYTFLIHTVAVLNVVHALAIQYHTCICFMLSVPASEAKKSLATLYVKCTQHDVHINNLLSRARTSFQRMFFLNNHMCVSSS